jgi:peptide/nickel transport system substrate-binding protein
MTIPSLFRFVLLAAAFLVPGCDDPETGPLRVVAIGGPPQLRNPNLQSLDPPSAYLVEAVAEGLVRFDADGEIEPALAQSWIVSDDGLRYTFRIRRTSWSDGTPVTAEQVAMRLRAAASRASRSPLKPMLGAIQNVVAMTDRVVEISLRGPRPNLLQLLAQPEMAIILNGRTAGPYAIAAAEAGAVRLTLPESGDDGDRDDRDLPDIDLRGEPAAVAVARFAQGEADLITGGTAGDLPLARAARLPANRLVFDPVPGFFGLAFMANEGPLADPAVRRAMSMAVDRQAIATAFAVPGLQPRNSLLTPIADELPRPAQPDWGASPMPMRRELAARTIAALAEPLRVRVAMPDGPGYRLLFAYIRRDWRLVGIEAVRVGPQAAAELRLIDAVAPAAFASWYLRHFTCDTGRVCDATADQALAAARLAPRAADRRAQFAIADQILTGLTPFIPIGAPVRWSLVSPRLNGFRPNRFARHPAGTLIAEEF